MQKIRNLFLGVALSLCASVPFAKPAVPTIAQLAAFPRMSSFTLSPDGKRMAALEARGEERVILVWRTEALGTAPTVIGTTKMKFRSVSFIKNDMLAVSLWQPYDARLGELTKTFVTKLYLTDLEGKEWHEPLQLPAPKSEIEERLQSISIPAVLDRLPADPDHILVVNNVGMDAGDVYKVNVRTRKSERIQRAGEHDAGYITDRAGNLRARLKADVDGTGAYVVAEIRNLQTGNWEEHFRSYLKNRDTVEIVGFAKDPNTAFVRSNVGRDKAVIYEYDIAARKPREVLFEHKYFEAGTISINRGDDNELSEILSITYQGPRERDVLFVDPTIKATEQALRNALKIKARPVRLVDPATGTSEAVPYDADFNLTVVASAQNYKTAVIMVDGPARPPEYYLLREGRLSLLSKAFPDIDGRALGTTDLVYYKARDGLNIPAFLTKPNEELCGPGPWAAVVHPHGGPWARDAMTFDGSMWVPLMVSRCHAVLQPQFRGSEGWGRKLWMAGDAEWGQKMQDDKDDGAKWLVEQKIAQSGRIAMFGFSYGGYSAMTAAVRPNGLYKCAIAGAGVSDIDRIWARFYTNPFYRDAQGTTVKGLNPREKADQIKIPIMVYTGERDQTVPVEQSEWFVDAARKSGQKVDYTVIADYDHGPAWTRQIMGNQLQLIENYLTKGCGGSGL